MAPTSNQSVHELGGYTKIAKLCPHYMRHFAMFSYIFFYNVSFIILIAGRNDLNACESSSE